MKKNLWGICALTAWVSAVSYAQQSDSTRVDQLDEVVISDTKFAQRKEKSGKVIVKISRESLEQRKGQTLAQVLSTVAGVEINGNQSANGKNLGYYVRGGRNQQVLIVIDGVPVTDPSGISFEFDLRLLAVDQIESIEIMKGAASTLYGTGAATAVINITTKGAGKKVLQGQAYLNIGSNNSAAQSTINGQEFNQGFSVNGTSGGFTYQAGVNSTESGNLSQLAPPAGQTYEEDRFSRLNYHGKFGYKVSSRFRWEAFAQVDRIANDYDQAFDNTGTGDTPINTTTSEQTRWGFTPTLSFRKGELKLIAAYSKVVRRYDEFNAWSGTTDASEYAGRSVNVDLFSKYALTDKLYLVAGTQYQFHDMQTQTPFGAQRREATKFALVDPYITLVWTTAWGGNVNAGARWNHHSEYGNNWVYNINPSYQLKSLPVKLFSSVSTAFVTPSLFQLYSPFGNTQLKPETNRTVELGAEAQFLQKKLRVSAVGFYREQVDSFGFFTDPVTFNSNYINITGLNKARGVEADMVWQVHKKVQVTANYTFTQVDEALNRLIPKHKANIGLDITPSSRWFINVNYHYVDTRRDLFFDGATFATTAVDLSAYRLFNGLVKYEVFKNQLTLFAAVTNIQNANFTETIGYTTRGRNFSIGLNLNL